MSGTSKEVMEKVAHSKDGTKLSPLLALVLYVTGGGLAGSGSSVFINNRFEATVETELRDLSKAIENLQMDVLYAENSIQDVELSCASNMEAIGKVERDLYREKVAKDNVIRDVEEVKRGCEKCENTILFHSHEIQNLQQRGK